MSNVRNSNVPCHIAIIAIISIFIGMPNGALDRRVLFSRILRGKLGEASIVDYVLGP